ncbi:MAG: ATP-binding protein [Candidatus Pacebacteria bacterium]|nr:ATP-binding protein [Candidatus Paceibacterota bacterium]
MKIAVVGKGGSGKTTVSALLARYAASKGRTVLAADADINQHLGASLGFMKNVIARLPKLGRETDCIKEYLRGTNPRIASAAVMVKTTPPSTGSRLLHLTKPNPLWKRFIRQKNGVRFMAVGAMDESDIGVKCYHAKTGGVELILGHLIDDSDEYVICDMTAGADSFASGMFVRFDITLLVAEPTEKSVAVCKQYIRYAKGWKLNVKIIGNQVESKEDTVFLKKAFGKNLITCLSRSAHIKQSDRGTILPITRLEGVNKKALDAVMAEINTCKKNWEKSYRDAVSLHIKNAESWANKATGTDVTKQIEPDFSLINASSA